MTTDPIAAALDHIRSITPADNPWTADDVSSFSPWEPDESDHAIATILNAVVAGQLISRHTLADALEAERARADNLMRERDDALMRLGSITEHHARLAEARLKGWRAGRDDAAEIAVDRYEAWSDAVSCPVVCDVTACADVAAAIRALPEPKEASHD